ncbi:MAG: hypothetical protein ABEL97_02350 [Salinibacter sp.]
MFAPATDLVDTTRVFSDWTVPPVLRALLLPVALLVAGFLAGCESSGPTGSAPPDAPVETDRTLRPGETASTDTGVRVMAARGALDEETSVSGGTMADPTSETPMPDFARPVGSYYRVGGGRNIDVAADEPPLYLALPVPEGANTSRLALAVRVPQEYTTDNAQASAEYGWSVVRGAYEPERGLLVTPVRFLMKRGTAVAVVESEDHTSPSMADASGETLFAKAQTFFSQNAKAAAQTRSTAKSAQFVVKCVGFNNASACGTDEKNDVRQYLNKAVQDFVGGFQSPALPKTFFGNKPVWKIYKNGQSWCKGNTAGKYLSLTKVAITCYDGSGDPSEGTTRHEFFHATQYSYGPISWAKLPNKRPDWVIEGTAELAESTSASAGAAAVRGPDPLRNVDRKLTVEMGKPQYAEYWAQDFWVYLINSRNATLSKILEPLFSPQPKAENEPHIKKVHQLYSVTDDHWDWVRNQAFESKVKQGNADLNPSCVFDPEAVTGSPRTITYDAKAQNGPMTRSVSVNELTAQVLKVNIKNSYGAKQVLAKVKATTSAADGYAKAYGNYSTATTTCHGGGGSSSSASIQQGLSSNSTKTVYLLLSNSGRGKSASFNLRLSHTTSAGQAPTAKITRPSANATHKGRVLFLEATASDPDGGSITGYTWKITAQTQGGGFKTVTYTGKSVTTEDLWSYHGFYPGDFNIKLIVTDDEGQQTSTRIELRVRPSG